MACGLYVEWSWAGREAGGTVKGEGVDDIRVEPPPLDLAAG